MRRGLALVLVVGVLGVLAVLGSAFAVLSRLERRAASLRVEGTRAFLAARSGIEDAAARLALGQDFAYGGEDLDGNGVLTAGIETTEQRYGPGVLDVAGCPLALALRSSFFINDRTGPGAPPVLERVDGRLRALSGRLADRASWTLKVEDLNARIHINGGALDLLDRDPDGPAGAPEIAPLAPNGVEDHRDASPEGPNGFLVRLLDNLDRVLTGSAGLGGEVVGARPPGGYRSLEQLRSVLSPARYDLFRPFLTVRAWVDPTVLKPQPMDGRPRRFEDIDDTHRIGTATSNLCGLDPLSSPSGDGTEVSPWTVTLVKEASTFEPARNYPVSWERGYVYAWRQLRIAPPGFEPRAPVSLNTAAPEVLAAVLAGLKGTYLEVWEGSGGWDDGTGWFHLKSSPPATPPGKTYAYPSPATEETPWHRTRLDYGSSYGAPGRPYYAPNTYSPAAGGPLGIGGKSLVQCAPLGRLKETEPLTAAQALAVASEIRSRISQKGPFRTWAELGAFVEALPLWEDADGDGLLDGAPYPVTDGLARTYTRHAYEREDASSDGLMNNRVFSLASGSWGTGDPVWVDRGPGGLQAGDVKGLTFVQKDLIRAMANPNTDLNDFNPDANLWKEADKTDLAGIGSVPASYAHTTELALETPGVWGVSALGRLLGRDGRLLASRLSRARLAFDLVRDTTQADFMRGFSPPLAPASSFFQGPAAPYTVSGGQPLVSYPEPQTAGGLPAANAAYDGQVGLGFVECLIGRLQAPLFDSMVPLPGMGMAPEPDLRGPYQAPLVAPAGARVGSVFPDGVYGEKDAALKFPGPTGLGFHPAQGNPAFWVKVHWFPEACPRPHALYSQAFSLDMSTNANTNSFFVQRDQVPLDDIWSSPVGWFFLPARNAWSQDACPSWGYAPGHGASWPSRCLELGKTHAFYTSECLNRKGYPGAAGPKPVGRFGAHRWEYVANLGHIPVTILNIGMNVLSATLGLATTDRTTDPITGGGDHGLGSVQGQRKHTLDGTGNHLRFGEITGIPNMNYASDATVAEVSAGFPSWEAGEGLTLAAQAGRYFKEDGAAYVSPGIRGARPLRATWTEVPCALWFDTTVPFDDWDDTLADDQFGPGGAPGANGKRDVRVDLEVWDDDGLLARFSDPGAQNRIPGGRGRLYYKAVFVNEWDEATKANFPLDVTPFLDDVTFLCGGRGGPRFLDFDEGEGA